MPYLVSFSYLLLVHSAHSDQSDFPEIQLYHMSGLQLFLMFQDKTQAPDYDFQGPIVSSPASISDLILCHYFIPVMLSVSGTYHHLYQGFTRSRCSPWFFIWLTHSLLPELSLKIILVVCICSFHTPNSSLLPSPFGNHKFVFCVCESVSVL